MTVSAGTVDGVRQGEATPNGAAGFPENWSIVLFPSITFEVGNTGPASSATVTAPEASAEAQAPPDPVSGPGTVSSASTEVQGR